MPVNPDTNLEKRLTNLVIGQDPAIFQMIPYLRTALAGLAPEGRPAAVFMLTGPTGVGKTFTVESIARVLHGTNKPVLRVDCGEYQTDHEIAKLIGAPPGYLGHRESVPTLSQQKIQEVTTSACPYSVVLFDEIEKAAPSVLRILLGILDRGVLTLGNCSKVHFENSLIFFTSNLGSAEMTKAREGGMTFARTESDSTESITGRACKKFFSPEFLNRVDEIVHYVPLSVDDIRLILTNEMRAIAAHATSKLSRSTKIWTSTSCRQELIRLGFDGKSGARELKRVLNRHIRQPLAERWLDIEGEKPAKVQFDVDFENGGFIYNLYSQGQPVQDVSELFQEQAA